MSDKIEKGKVLWFDVKKGFGFIKRETGSDVFVHYSKILGEPGEFRLLCEGDEVEFEVFLADRGGGSNRPQARSVKLIKRLEGASARGGKNAISREERDSVVRGHVISSKEGEVSGE
jgi:CspA family cold shock protein